jgi:hypothetical protein
VQRAARDEAAPHRHRAPMPPPSPPPPPLPPPPPPPAVAERAARAPPHPPAASVAAPVQMCTTRLHATAAHSSRRITLTLYAVHSHKHRALWEGASSRALWVESHTHAPRSASAVWWYGPTPRPVPPVHALVAPRPPPCPPLPPVLLGTPLPATPPLPLWTSPPPPPLPMSPPVPWVSIDASVSARAVVAVVAAHSLGSGPHRELLLQRRTIRLRRGEALPQCRTRRLPCGANARTPAPHVRACQLTPSSTDQCRRDNIRDVLHWWDGRLSPWL